MGLDLIIFLIVAAVVGLFIVALVTTAFFEKQRIKDFDAVAPGAPESVSPYFAAMNDAARRLGFQPAGVFAQSRGSQVYQARVALWISADGQTMVRIAGGKTAGVPIKRTSLITFLEPDRIVETSDEVSMADLSGLTDRKILLNGHLEELFACHHLRLAGRPGSARVFRVADALTAYESLQAMKAAEMERLRLGRFLNPERTIWRHTLKGAWLIYFKGFRSQWAEAKTQQHRASLKRPGHA